MPQRPLSCLSHDMRKCIFGHSIQPSSRISPNSPKKLQESIYCIYCPLVRRLGSYVLHRVPMKMIRSGCTDWLVFALFVGLGMGTRQKVQFHILWFINVGPAEPGYTLPLQTVEIQIGWLFQKLTDLDLHCLSFSMWISINNLDQVIWLAKNWKCVRHLNLFSMTRLIYCVLVRAPGKKDRGLFKEEHLMIILG